MIPLPQEPSVEDGIGAVPALVEVGFLEVDLVVDFDFELEGLGGGDVDDLCDDVDEELRKVRK